MRFRTAYTLALAGGTVVLGAFISYFAFSEFQAKRQILQRSKVHFERGINLYHRKAYPRAEAELRRALRANPDEWKAPFYVGTIQIDRKRYGLAIPYLERALTLNPREPKILNALGVTYFKLGRLDMAKGYFWASLALDPGSTAAKGMVETMAKLQWRAARAALAEK
jgi:Flp pilus assembly protein TadD